MSLILFVDALPYLYSKSRMQDFVGETTHHIGRFTPSFGYSSNLHWEMVADKYPDDLGFFTDWNINYDQYLKSPEGLGPVNRMLSFMEKLPWLTFPVRYALNKVFNFYFANIPFHIRRYFSNSGRYLCSDPKEFVQHTGFSQYQLAFQTPRMSDEAALDLLEDAIEQGHKDIFAYLTYPDKLGHIYGIGEEYADHMASKMKTLFRVLQRYLSLNQDEDYLIFSDHGMSDINDTVSMKLEKVCGTQQPSKYMYFCDSVVLRVWVRDSGIRADLEVFLAESKHGKLLNAEERETFRITRREFGDLIFVLHEGNVFKPNYFGVGIRM